MATHAETSAVYAAGAVQGVVPVTVPAASQIFTDPDGYGLSNTQYGVLLLPQVATAIAASLLGSRLAGRIGRRRCTWPGSGSGSSRCSCSSSASSSSRTRASRSRSGSSRPRAWGSASA